MKQVNSIELNKNPTLLTQLRLARLFPCSNLQPLLKIKENSALSNRFQTFMYIMRLWWLQRFRLLLVQDFVFFYQFDHNCLCKEEDGRCLLHWENLLTQKSQKLKDLLFIVTCDLWVLTKISTHDKVYF